MMCTSTVVSGQVSTVNFSNKLRRGDLTVKKTSEDGLTEGMKFRLYGTSLSGIEVNEYVSDCISKRVKANNGERNKYYIENNHPAIIDAGTFARVQEEIVRRSGKPKVKQKGTKTELSRYSSRYALSELLICGECRTPYRRCTWTAKGKRKIVWRCINRLDYGKKYCHHSPSIEESLLQDAVMRAIMQTAKQGNDGRLFGHGETGKGLYPNPTLRGERYLSKQKDTPYRNGRECFLCI